MEREYVQVGDQRPPRAKPPQSFRGRLALASPATISDPRGINPSRNSLPEIDFSTPRRSKSVVLILRNSNWMVIEAVDEGIPQIPFDLFVRKKCKGLLNITNPFKSLVYVVQAADCSDRRRRNRVLVDPSGVTLISIHRYQDGSWRGFKGDDIAGENLVFRVERTLNSFDRVEMDAFIVRQNEEDSIFKMKGSVYCRSCTIYHGNSIVAQTSMMYTLGFRKIFVSRDKFRITIFPGFSDYAIVVGLVAVFLDGRK